MGYWEEKQGYEEDLERKRFCNVCGRHLNSKNILGKCSECEDIVCKNCGKMIKGKITCKDCIEGNKGWFGGKRKRKAGWLHFLSGASLNNWKKEINELRKEAKNERKRLKNIKSR